MYCYSEQKIQYHIKHKKKRKRKGLTDKKYQYNMGNVFDLDDFLS
jgi:hypothetical protein